VWSDEFLDQGPRSGGIFTEHAVLGFHRGEQRAGRVANDRERVVTASSKVATKVLSGWIGSLGENKAMVVPYRRFL
jgi:hypothetical protein